MQTKNLPSTTKNYRTFLKLVGMVAYTKTNYTSDNKKIDGWWQKLIQKAHSDFVHDLAEKRSKNQLQTRGVFFTFLDDDDAF